MNPNKVRRKSVANSQHKASSLSDDVDAIQLRDQLVHLQKEMNALMKERDIAKAQQVFIIVCLHASLFMLGAFFSYNT